MLSSDVPVPQLDIVQQKPLIICWMMFWPWSLLSYVVIYIIYNPIRNLFHLASSEVKATMDGIAQEAFNEISNDFELETQDSANPDSSADDFVNAGLAAAIARPSSRKRPLC